MINLSSLFAITLCLYPYANMDFIIFYSLFKSLSPYLLISKFFHFDILNSW